MIVGGLGTLIGPMIGAIVLGSLKLALGQQTLVDNSLVLGVDPDPGGAAASRAASLPALPRWRPAARAGAGVSRRQARSPPPPRLALQDAER